MKDETIPFNIDMCRHEDDKIHKLWYILEKEGYRCDKPTRFLFVLLYFSNNTENEDLACHEWKIDFYNSGKIINDSTFCICSHIIHELHYIKNKLNGNVLRIGRDCIDKIKNDELKIGFDKYIREFDYNKKKTKQNKTGKYRQCECCRKYRININKNINITKCKTCNEKYLKFKCRECNNQIEELKSQVKQSIIERSKIGIKNYSFIFNDLIGLGYCSNCYVIVNELGNQKLLSGKYKNCTYYEVYNIDPDYCNNKIKDKHLKNSFVDFKKWLIFKTNPYIYI
jgi:hypothetical protein